MRDSSIYSILLFLKKHCVTIAHNKRYCTYSTVFMVKEVNLKYYIRNKIDMTRYRYATEEDKTMKK